MPESIEWFIEDQSFLRSDDLVPPPPPPPFLVIKLSFFLSFPVCRRLSFSDGGGGGGGETQKTWSLKKNYKKYGLG